MCALYMYVRLYIIGPCVGEGTIRSYVFLWRPEGEIRRHPLFYCSFYSKEAGILAEPEISKAIRTSQESCTQRSPLSLWNYKQAVIYARFYTNTVSPHSNLASDLPPSQLLSTMVLDLSSRSDPFGRVLLDLSTLDPRTCPSYFILHIPFWLAALVSPFWLVANQFSASSSQRDCSQTVAILHGMHLSSLTHVLVAATMTGFKGHDPFVRQLWSPVKASWRFSYNCLSETPY